MSEALKTASVLAFERKLDVSDGLFYAGVWAERLKSSSWPGVEVREKSVRGTISNRLKKSGEQDPAKLDAAIEKPNLQTVDVASLPAGYDTLKLSFTVRALGGVGQPSACNNTEYRAKLNRAAAAYFQANGARELARRYAGNLANGRFLWRNRLGAEQVEVRVELFQNGAAAKFWTFDALAFSLNDFEVPPDYRAALAEMAQCIEEGLIGPKPALLQVTAYARLGAGQEVFPSQELILERGSKNKSKTLYQVTNIAGMHSQKLGNALRTIDTWYPGQAEQGPIAAEPYGAVTSLGKAYRQPKDKVDFYSLLDSWIINDKAPTLENQHFVMAVLIRGGVFGKAEE
ncbi:CRISPR-associated protein Csy3 [Deltaproteobacteria bacterium]|nr:CRISPR-associated protein Csy3 [Deltaproteobacteria bacterium]